VHSVADCGNQSLLLLGLNRSARPPDAEYPLGHGRAIYFWSFIVALMLFSMGGLFSIYEEISEVLNLITLQYGADVVIAVKARMTENVSAPVMLKAINRCERALRAAFPQVRWLFFEPDVEK
jgi:divalent metal cation (Fe/Co/Zn/Cd) transporter